mmetsp:Transcript_36446/g.55944  ORF Transcript_36446/g.55944 Transcript_36446/m.55944 type:complete len:194 (+) Transcript_36446:3539-4120(+)
MTVIDTITTSGDGKSFKIQTDSFDDPGNFNLDLVATSLGQKSVIKYIEMQIVPLGETMNKPPDIDTLPKINFNVTKQASNSNKTYASPQVTDEENNEIFIQLNIPPEVGHFLKFSKFEDRFSLHFDGTLITSADLGEYTVVVILSDDVSKYTTTVAWEISLYEYVKPTEDDDEDEEDDLVLPPVDEGVVIEES